MGVRTSLARAKQMALYWENYMNYLNNLDDRQPNIGQGEAKPEQIKTYIKPFSQTLPASVFFETYSNEERWNAYQTQFVGFTRSTIDTDTQDSLDINRFRSAKVMITTGRGAKTVKTAKTTKRKYTSRGGVSGGIAFGSNGSLSEVETFNSIKEAIAPAASETATSIRVSRIKEKL